MFESLTEKLGGVFKKLTGRGKLSEANIQDALKEVRLALLEADVNYKIVRKFVEDIRERAVGQEVLHSLTPGQQFIKIVSEEMTRMMGGQEQGLDFRGKPPHVLMLVGLQGSGKTTSAAKLAQYLRKRGRHPLLVPADVYRPAAIDQLQKLGRQLNIPVYASDPKQNPVVICADAARQAGRHAADLLIIDTAGRLHIDEALMAELVNIKTQMTPSEILLVADAMTGQDAVTVARDFDAQLALSGVILTKMEGDARGGAALSIKAVTEKPIKFIGVGEKLDAFQAFHPERMASQILGMGDVLSLIERAQSEFDEKEALKLQEKLKKNEFDLEDFRSQLGQLRKLGSLEQIMGMLPGLGAMRKIKDMKPDETELVRIEAVISSMTRAERRNYKIINGSRRRRIAKGSGTSVQEVNRVLKNFIQTKSMMETFTKKGPKKLNALFR